MTVPPVRVPHANETSVTGECAIVSGFGAWFLGDALARGPLRAELEALLRRGKVSADDRAKVERACLALAAAGALWSFRERATSTSGSPDRQAGEAQAPSGGNEDGIALSAQEAALALGVSDRQVRVLASMGRLPGRRDSSGRWFFTAAVVDAERERRRSRDEREGRVA